MLRELIWAVLLAAVSVSLHAAVGTWMIRVLRFRGHDFPRLILCLAMVGLLLAHFAEAVVWALFYLYQGGFGTFEKSVYFSLASYTTIGYGDLLLPQGLRVVGALEGMVGTLLFGVSVAVLVGVVQTRAVRSPRRKSDTPP